MTNREDFLIKLRATFKDEAREGIAEITSYLLALENTNNKEQQQKLVEAIFRNAHSMKGAARAVNFIEIEKLSQATEGLLSNLKSKRTPPSRQQADLLHDTINLLSELLAQGEIEIKQDLKEKVFEFITELNATSEYEQEGAKLDQETEIEQKAKYPAESNKVPKSKEPSVEEAPVNYRDSVKKDETAPTSDKASIEEHTNVIDLSKAQGSIRVSIEKLDSMLNQSEEIMSVKKTLVHINETLKDIIGKTVDWEKEHIKRLTGIQKYNITSSERNSQSAYHNQGKTSVQFMEFFSWGVSSMKTIKKELEQLRVLTDNEVYSTAVKAEGLLDEVKRIISVPFSTILDPYPKIVRDLAKDKGKKVKIEIVGSNQEIDRRIIEELQSPFQHILRNSIDHGIEMPDERIKKHKNETGTIRIEIRQIENSRLEVKFSDDGAGINIEKLKEKGLKSGKFSKKKLKEYHEDAFFDMLFESGFTTSKMITDLSGRGLGLSIAKEKIERLGGSISVQNKGNQGTTFHIEIPLSLVSFRGISVMVNENEFIVPTSKIIKLTKIEKSAIKHSGNKGTFNFEDKIVPLKYLSDILEIPVSEKDDSSVLVLILGNNGQRCGFIIDDLMDEDTILMKKFNPQLKRIRNIEGASVTGSGKVVPILNVSDVLKSATLDGKVYRTKKVAESTQKASVLIVEDSITSRMLLKNILETAGYQVKVAIDGVDGYTKLKSEPVDLVVSDVDMPRMGGLDMTAKIRSDKDLKDIPIVLVTSLSKREDRERGMEVGASAYIVKSNFDQSNLLDVVERLVGQ